LALDELHGQERPAVGQRAEIVNRRDRWMLQLAGDARLTGKAQGHPGRGAVLVLQHLHRHFTGEDGIGGPVDDAHSAAIDLVAEHVTLRDGRRHGGLRQFGAIARGQVRVGVRNR
jgi:hypothetical protein